MKKFILSFGTLATIVAPIAAVISCGSDDNKTTNPTQGTNSLDKGENWGKESFIDPKATMLESQNLNEYKERQASGQPFGLHFHPRDLAIWNAKDADKAFNKGTIPLHNRDWAYKILSTQLKNRLDILASLSKNTSRTYSGTAAFEYEADRIFTMWSNINSMVQWGGSAGEGLIITPKAGDINAAHKNGVPILGTAFFPPNVFGGSEQMYEDLVKKVNGKFIIADKMIQMAKDYGFDGWFLNLETTISKVKSTTLKAKLLEFVKYLHAESVKQDLFTNLYDWNVGADMVGDSDASKWVSIDFQNREDATKHHGLTTASGDRAGLGYNFDTGAFTNSDEGGEWTTQDQNSWIYTYFKRHDPLKSDEDDLKFFDDSEGHRDPRNTSHGDAFKEMSKTFQQRTVIDGTENFTTSFQLGGGHKWFKDGEETPLQGGLAEGYRNLGVQSVLPTWKYILDQYDASMDLVSTPGDDITVGDKTFKVTIDEDGKCYNGSTMLHIEGKMKANTTVTNKLYGTTATAKATDKFTLIVEGNDDVPQMAIWLDGADKPELIQSSNKESLGNNFYRHTYEMPDANAGKKLDAFGVAYTFTHTKATETHDIHSRISQMNFIVNSDATAANEISGFKNDGNWLFSGSRRARVSWNMTDSSKVDHYAVYTTDPNDATLRTGLINTTGVPAAYLNGLPFSKNVPLIIDALDAGGNLISTKNVVLETTFESMKDASKWTSEFVQDTGDDAAYTIGTGHGYTASFKDADGSIYIGDDYTSLFKVDTKGNFNGKGNGAWGRHLLKDFRDVKIKSISSFDEHNIVAITRNATVHKVNKDTGVADETFKTTDLKDKIEAYATANSIKLTGEAKIIETIIDTKVVAGKTIITFSYVTKEGSGDAEHKVLKTLQATIAADGTATINAVEDGLTIDSIIKTATGTKVAYKSGGNTYLADATVTNGVISAIDKTNAIDVTAAMMPFLNGTYKTELEKVITDDADFVNGLDILASGHIIDAKTLTDGTVVLINEWGMIAKVKGADVKVASTMTAQSWVTLRDHIAAVNADYGHNSVWGFARQDADNDNHADYTLIDPNVPKETVVDDKGVSHQVDPMSNRWYTTIQSMPSLGTAALVRKPKYDMASMLAWIYKFDQNTILKRGLVNLDTETNTLTAMNASDAEYGWWGFCRIFREINKFDLSAFLGTAGTDSIITPTSTVQFNKEDNKRIDEPRFIQQINANLYVVGGSAGKFAALDGEYVQQAFGSRQYTYDGKLITEEQAVYDGGDTTIPSYLTQ